MRSKIFNAAVAVCVAACAVFISGCATMSPTQQLIVNVAIQQGTSKFIEHKDSAPERSARAAEVIRVVGLLKATIAGEDTTVDELQARALDIVQHAGLELSDQALANTLIAAVGDVLRERISAGVLKPGDKVRVESVLDNIAATAQVYVTAPASAALARVVRGMMIAEIDARYARHNAG